MSRLVKWQKGSAMVPEVVAGRQFLPGCSNCHAPHPLAMKPARDLDACPVCDTPVGDAGELIIEKGMVGGPLGFLAEMLLNLGSWLRNIGRRIAP